MTVVSCTAGKVAGFKDESVERFLGIPFAAPPLGARRFQAPQPVEGWTGVRDATAYSPIAFQPPGLLEQMIGQDAAQDEDCLTLNVITPRSDDRRRPVLVWVHGGGFLTGAGSLAWFEGHRLASRTDTVVVTVNYRLGAWGFLYLEDAGEPLAPNRALLDLVAALEWIRDNIAAFGGDPHNVTLAGESAGAMAVSSMLAMPKARGLIHRAAVQSGSGHDVLTAQVARENTAIFLEALGASSDPDELAQTPVERILIAQGALWEHVERIPPFLPVIDGQVLPAHPTEEIQEGAAATVPLLVGTNADELLLLFSFVPELTDVLGTLYERRLRLTAGDQVDDIIAAYRRSRPGATEDSVRWAVFGDLLHRIPSLRFAEAQVRAGGIAYVNVFSWRTPVLDGRPGACHFLDVPFLFDTLDIPGAATLVGDAPPRELAQIMGASWAAFAKTGDPANELVPHWPAYDLQRRATALIDVPTRVPDDPWADERTAWNGLLEPSSPTPAR